MKKKNIAEVLKDIGILTQRKILKYKAIIVLDKQSRCNEKM
jgi:hypothetical protein